MEQHILPAISNLPCGVVNVYLYHDDSITDLTYPDAVTLLSISPFSESVDIFPGTLEIGNVDIILAEDYSTHAEGFWYKLVNGYPQFDVEMMFSISEGTDQTFLFRGRLFRENVKWREYFVSGTDRVRGISFKLVSLIDSLKNVSISDLMTNIDNYAELLVPSGGGNPDAGVWFVKMENVIRAMMELAYGVSYASTVVINNSNDILFKTNELEEQFTEMYLLCYEVSLAGAYTYTYLFQPGGVNSWAVRFPNAFELLKSICQTFGVIPRYSYGIDNDFIDGTESNNYHRITLVSRGSSGVVTEVGSVTESDLISDTPLRARTVKATLVNVADPDAPVSYWHTAIDSALGSGVSPIHATFDIDIAVDYTVETFGFAGSYGLFYSYATSSILSLDSVLWYNRESSSYTELDLVTPTNWDNLCKAICEYYFYRFTAGRMQFDRVYGDIRGNIGGILSHKWNKIMTGTTISDGVSSDSYYASVIEKDIQSNKLSVSWVKD